ncbi:MAG: hypothetical protein J07HR59_01440 [Halorubrum sp. J07HR59]|nr:MAG: hypothetical protein J07HR59_01440 [Halorubrum sp. J07HR59]
MQIELWHPVGGIELRADSIAERPLESTSEANSREARRIRTGSRVAIASGQADSPTQVPGRNQTRKGACL